MKKILQISLFAGLNFLSACSGDNNKSEETSWTLGQGPIPAIVSSAAFQEQESSVATPSEMIVRSPQKSGYAEVEDSYAQKIYNNQGDLIAVKAKWVNQDFSSLEKIIKNMHTNKYAFLEKAKMQILDLKSAIEIFPVKTIISNKKSHPEVLYQVDYIPSNGMGVTRLQLTDTLAVRSKEFVSSNFIDAQGKVFPAGPGWSNLADVQLKQLIGDGSLTKGSHRINHQGEDKALSEKNIFNFETSDSRFDQVQAFYFVDRTLNFFQSKLGVTIPFAIEIKTGIGTNAASYYPGTMLLGPGDGVNYINIMRDPTVVMHETGHALVDAMAKLPYQKEGGSLNEAFADFFATSILKHSKLGELSSPTGTPKRDLNNQLTLANKIGKVYPDSLIVSGTLWEIKSQIGEAQGLKLALKTLARLGPGGNFSSFANAVTQAMEQDFSDIEKKQINEVLKERKWLN
jgi:hypothetical protein